MKKKCKKITYKTEQSASKRAFMIWLNSSISVMHAYKCDKCEGWHLTSMSRKLYHKITSNGKIQKINQSVNQ